MRKISILLIITVLFVTFGLTGCKKKSAETDAAKTPAQYKAQAEKEITEENADAELEKLQKEIDAELGDDL